MMKWELIKKQDTILAVSVMIVAVLSFFGFHYFFPSLDVQSDYIQEIISAFYGVFFATVLTIYLLNKQTESQQNKQKHQKVFEEKVRLFKELLLTLEINFEGYELSTEKLNKLEILLIKIAMIASEDTIKKFQELYDYFISEQNQEKSKFSLLLELTSLCRQELGLSEGNLNDELSKSLNQLLSDWEARGSYASYMHNKDYVLKLAECSDDEKEECFPLIVDILKLIVLVKKEGFLAAEDKYPKLNYKWFVRWLSLAVDGTDHGTISTIVELEIFFGKYRGLELLKRYIGYRGVIFIQFQNHPIFFYDWIKSLFSKNIQNKLNQLITKEHLESLLIQEETRNPDEAMQEFHNLQEKRLENLPQIIEKFYLQNAKQNKSLGHLSEKQKETLCKILNQIFLRKQILYILLTYEKDFLNWYLEKYIHRKYAHILDDYLLELENYQPDSSVTELDLKKMDKLVEIISIIPKKDSKKKL